MSLTIPEYLMEIAKTVALRSKCRRQVGCVIADKSGRILSTGYNGYPCGTKNCTAETCTNPPGAADGVCHAIHAEINALIYLRQPEDAHYVVITRAPCGDCSRSIKQLPFKHLIYQDNNKNHIPDYFAMFLDNDIKITAHYNDIR